MARGGLQAVSSPELLFTNAASQQGSVDSDDEGCISDSAGGAIGVVVEGLRPLLVEIQALATPRQPLSMGGGGEDDVDEDESDEGGGGGFGGGGGGYGSKRRDKVYVPLVRNITGFRDRTRVAMLLEVLSKHSTIKVGGREGEEVQL